MSTKPFPRIIFMGTPEFAVPTLDILLKNNYNIVAVITAPDKPAGRGLKITMSPVKEYASQHQLKVLQPTNLKDPEFVQQLQALQPDLQIVVAFRMLPEVVWSLPPLGTYNLHASLLPKYRGAAPINFAIINGETQTGVTTFKIQKEIDTGHIALQQSVEITATDTAGTLHDKLKIIGAELMLKTVQLIEKNELALQPQNNSEVCYAPKITKEFCHIHWNQPSEKIYNFIRGLSPYPGAYTYYTNADKKVLWKILFGEMIMQTHNLSAGTILTDNKKYIQVATQDGYISITQIQAEGKRAMSIEEFLRGNKVESGKVLF